jgi:leader peptidase (prepilin peptidase)/N-methyltransferase
MLTYILIAALFGLLIGSFLNVCIYRWPRDLSVVRPRSACVECSYAIAWYDNVPLLSYIVLKGRCRHCQAKINWRYPVVELLTALAFARFVRRYGLTVEATKYCVFAALQIGLIFSDLETLILPDEFTVGGIFIGLGFALFTRVPDRFFNSLCIIAGFPLGPRWADFGEALFGAVVLSSLLWLLGWVFEKIRKMEGLGFGDVKMIAMVGAFLGLNGALLTVIGGSLTGSVIGLAYIKLTGKEKTHPLPFASFLGAAALLVAMWAK